MSNGSGGYKRPPVTGRFKKGQSGNPRGRPPGRRGELPYETALGQTVTIRVDGQEREVSAEEAFLLKLRKQAWEGDDRSARTLLAALESVSPRGDGNLAQELWVASVGNASVNSALEPLRMAKVLDRFGENVRTLLEPWIVEAALNRFGDRRLTIEQQRIVFEATRTPHKVKWPEWWEIRE